MDMTKRTRALDITPHVKKLVWERDGGKCILCGSQFTAMPNAHYISRAHSGLGVEQNIVTLCMDCHHAYDNTAKRTALKECIREYLMQWYPDWDEEQLIYRK